VGARGEEGKTLIEWRRREKGGIPTKSKEQPTCPPPNADGNIDGRREGEAIRFLTKSEVLVKGHRLKKKRTVKENSSDAIQAEGPERGM